MQHELSTVFLDRATLDLGDLDLTALEQACASFTSYPRTSPQQTAERLAGRQVVITNKVVIDRAMMQANPQLKLILIAATGTNNVDLQAARVSWSAIARLTARRR